MDTKKMGPKMKRLVIEYASVLAVPPGGGLAAAMRIMTDPQLLQDNLRKACVWAADRIAEIKAAPDNTLGNDDEVIANHILEKLAERKAQQRRERTDGRTD